MAGLEGAVRPRGQEKPKGTLQWIAEGHYATAEVRAALRGSIAGMTAWRGDAGCVA